MNDAWQRRREWRQWARRVDGYPEGNVVFAEPASHYDDAWANAQQGWRSAPGRMAVLEPVAIQCMIAGGPFVDIGCGNGWLADLLYEMGGQVRVAIDTSATACALAEHPGRRQVLLGHRKVLAKVLRYLRYRTVILSEVLEHVLDDLRLLMLIPSRKSVVFSVPSYYTRGHVRWFRDRGQVKDRYGALIRFQDGAETRALTGTNRYFIFRGVRR